jgi:hypothetical protein
MHERATESEPTGSHPREVHDLTTLTTYRAALRVFFSRPGPRRIAATAASCWLARAALGPASPGEVALAASVAAWWPLQEWLMHRHLLHLEPRTIGPWTFDPIFAKRHRFHHQHPSDVDGTLLPVAVIEAAIPAASAALLLLSGPRRRTVTAMATYSTMALVYEWTHFLVHTGIRPEGGYFRKVRQNHRLHHFRSEHHWLGFTVPLVDRWLGTDPDPASVPRSQTATDLHGLGGATTDSARGAVRAGR